LWNQFNDNDNKRSNNDIEGYNLWLSLWLHKHPNIWKFIKKIKSEESSTYLKYYNINSNTLKKKHRNNKDILRDENLLKNKFDLVTNKIDTMEYLNRVANLIHDYGAKKTPSTTTSTVTTTSNDSDNLSGEEIDISV